MQKKAYRTSLPFTSGGVGPDGSSVLSPLSGKSVVPFNNVTTIQDILSGEKSIRDLYPDAGGSWGKGDDVEHNYIEEGDDYKRDVRDSEILQNMLGQKIENQPVWKVKVGPKGKGGSILFPSFNSAQKYIRDNKISQFYITRVAQQDPQKIISMALDRCFKVVSINTQRGVSENGSCFCVGKGLFLTCAHVIDKYNKNNPSQYSGFSTNSIVRIVKENMQYDAKVIKFDLDIDAALLECNEIDSDPFEFESLFSVGDDIFAIGSPHGYENNAVFGNIGSIGRKFFKNPKSPDFMFIDAMIFPGNSGCPIIKQDTGRVVGMVVMIVSPSGQYGLNAGVEAKYLEIFLGKL